jgi:DNA-binding response OmpR family regulator
MKTPPQLLIVDDQPMNVDILQTRLAVHGYDILTAMDGEAALELARTHQPDLMLLDIMMPKMNGIEVCQRLKSDASLPFMPIVMVTAKAESQDVVAGLEAGADEDLPKPLDQAALVARVKSMLRIKEWLRSHLQEVTVVFCDLRGFTAFSEATEPDDVMAVLREYHEAIGARGPHGFRDAAAHGDSHRHVAPPQLSTACWHWYCPWSCRAGYDWF